MYIGKNIDKKYCWVLVTFSLKLTLAGSSEKRWIIESSLKIKRYFRVAISNSVFQWEKKFILMWNEDKQKSIMQIFY